MSTFFMPVRTPTGLALYEFEPASVDVYPHLGVKIYRAQRGTNVKYFKLIRPEDVEQRLCPTSVRFEIERQDGTVSRGAFVPLEDGENETFDVEWIDGHEYIDGVLHYDLVYKSTPGRGYPTNYYGCEGLEQQISVYTQDLGLQEPLPPLQRELPEEYQRFAGEFSPYPLPSTRPAPQRTRRRSARKTIGRRRSH